VIFVAVATGNRNETPDRDIRGWATELWDGIQALP